MAGCTTKCDNQGLMAPVKDGITVNNPVLVQALGICSALAVTGFVRPTIVMCCSLLFVASISSFTVSLIRNLIPAGVRGFMFAAIAGVPGGRVPPLSLSLLRLSHFNHEDMRWRMTTAAKMAVEWPFD